MASVDMGANNTTTNNTNTWVSWTGAVNTNAGTTATGDYWQTWTRFSSTVTISNQTWQTWATTPDQTSLNETLNTLNVTWNDWASLAEKSQVAKETRRKTQIKRDRSREEIRANAKRLLFRILSDDEQQDLRRYNSVRIVGEKAIYEVGMGSDAIHELDIETGKVISSWCCHPAFSYPKEDRLAAVILALRHDEEMTRQKANKHKPQEATIRRIEARRAHMDPVAHIA